MEAKWLEAERASIAVSKLQEILLRRYGLGKTGVSLKKVDFQVQKLTFALASVSKRFQDLNVSSICSFPQFQHPK